MKTEIQTRWKFLREGWEGLKSEAGDCLWKIGEWKKQEGKNKGSGSI